MQKTGKDRSFGKVAFYYITACLISWTIWMPLVLNRQLGMSIPLLPYQYYLASFGPFLAAILAALAFEGIGGLKEFLLSRFRLGIKIRWYIFAIFSPFVLFVIAAAANILFGGQWPDMNRFAVPDALKGFHPLEALLFWILTYGLGEETGWRGFALPVLQKKLNPLAASWIIGPLWCFWHLPAFFMNENYMTMGPIGIFGWAISLTFGSILLTWLYNASGGSVIIVGVWHAFFDASVTGNTDAGMIGGIMSVMVIALALGIKARYGAGLGLKLKQ
jgi:uncharacterized protein